MTDAEKIAELKTLVVKQRARAASFEQGLEACMQRFRHLSKVAGTHGWGYDGIRDDAATCASDLENLLLGLEVRRDLSVARIARVIE